MKNIFCIAVLMLLFGLSSSLHAASSNYCGELTNAYGPYDYRKGTGELAANLNIVDVNHFTDDVEQGIKGVSGYLGADLDYTLRAFPNHHRALAAMARIALRDKTVQIPSARYPVECYFLRAIRFEPDDGIVHATYANYLFALGQSEKSLVEFKQAIALEPENATIDYNIGLNYLKEKDYEHANIYAKKAYALGFPLPGLKNLLVEAGKWDDKPLDQSSTKPNDQAANKPESNPGNQPDAKPADKPDDTSDIKRNTKPE